MNRVRLRVGAARVAAAGFEYLGKKEAARRAP